MNIVIVDYGMGNLRSVNKAFTKIGYDSIISSKPEEILKASKVVVPGVGAFRDAMKCLSSSGLAQSIIQFAKTGKPIMGICLGMQLFFEKSYEYGEYDGLGLLPGKIIKFSEYNASTKDKLKIPHMGWNNLEIVKQDPIFSGIENNSYAYFVHSYYALAENDIASAYTFYGSRILVAAQKDNVFATQFHPEKSSTVGLKILENFASL